MFIEALDARQLMAVYDPASNPPRGLDASFGDAGVFAFRKGFRVSGPLTRGDGATFVCGEIDRDGAYDIPYVVKIKDDGTADRTFGSGGYARLPFQDVTLELIRNEPNSGTRQTFSFTCVAYDAANDRVYVGAVRRTNYADGTTLAVTRLAGDGAIDAAYGTQRGTASYVPAKPAGAYSTASARAMVINPLADGSAVIAVDRLTQASDAYEPTVAAEQSLALLKLRPDGRPDPAYGTGGITQLLGGTVGPYVFGASGVYSYRTIKRGFFNDVRTDADGVTRVLLRYEAGPTTDGFSANPGDTDDRQREIDRGRFDIKARTVSADGVEDPSKAYGWRLFDSKKLNTHSRVTAAVADGNVARVTVTGDPGYGGTAALYTLRPDELARKRRLKPAGVERVFSIVQPAGGRVFAYNDGLITRLNPDYTPDTAFADDGVAYTGGVNHIPYARYPDRVDANAFVVADDRGRFLAIDTAGLVRFA